MFERILIPLDGSPVAETVLPHAMELGRRLGAEVILVEVVSALPSTPPMGAESEEIASRQHLEVRAAEAYLRRVASTWGVGGVRVRWEVRRGVPAEEIIRSAGEHAVSVIAMSTHGRTGLARMMFGSVADRVLRLAGMPVLLVRPKL